MVTKIQNMQDYVGYIKCGEILKSPVKNYQNPFILKCFECEDIHFLLESFIIHIQEHCEEDVFAPRERIETRTRNGSKKQEELENEIFPTENLIIKLEENNATDMEDPLIGVKSEIDREKSIVKEELEDSDDFNKSSDVEQRDDFEEVLCDSPDEFQNMDDSDSDEEYVAKSLKTRKPRVFKESTTSPFVETFVTSETNVKTLIEAYRNQPNLWNKDFPHFRNKERKQQIYQELTQEINNNLQLSLTSEQSAEIVSYIIRKHRDDYKRLQKHGKKGNKKDKNYKKCWFYEHLEFLRPKVKIQLHQLDPQLPDLTSEQIIQILEIYKGFTHLWDSNLIEFICSNKRNDAYNEMLTIMETNMNLKITKNVLEVYLNAVHRYFSKEKQLKTKSPGKRGPKAKAESKSDTSDYYEHMIFLYDHEGPFTCPECQSEHSKPLLFKVHKSQHDSSIPFKCSQCSKELKTIPSYTSHAKRHFDDFDYPCTECERRFFNHQELKMHQMTHTGAQPYCCEICGASFRYGNSLKKHQRRHRGIFTHTCHICSRGFYSKYRYNDHINSHLGIRQYICKVCSKGFITSRALKTHMVTHEDARNHACKLCGKTFKLKIGVLQHMRTHGNNVGIEDKYSH